MERLKEIYKKAINEKQSEDPLRETEKLKEELSKAINGNRNILMHYQCNCEAYIDLSMASFSIEVIALVIAAMSVCATVATDKTEILLCVVADLAVCLFFYFFFTKDREKYRRMKIILRFIEQEMNEKKDNLHQIDSSGSVEK